MTDHEKEILDKIKQSTEKTPVPESLAPDQIMKMLEEHNSTQASEHIPKKHGFSRGHRMRGGLIAAALVLVVGIGAHIRQQNLSSDSATSSTKGSSSIGTSSGKLASSDTLETATDYDEVYTYLQSYQDELDSSSVTGSTDNGIVMYSTETADSGARTDSSSSSSDSATASARAVDTSFSDTNVRTEGVGEADIVKTDGSYLYTLKANSQEISIVDIRSDQMKVVSVISLNENFQASEFYLSDQKLFVLGNMQNTQVDSDSKTLYRGSCTRIQTYDLADINNPKSIGTVEQSGYYRTSRFKDGYLEDAVKVLWKLGIYAESGMGCTGPIIRVSDANLAKAEEELKKSGYIN